MPLGYQILAGAWIAAAGFVGYGEGGQVVMYAAMAVAFLLVGLLWRLGFLGRPRE